MRKFERLEIESPVTVALKMMVDGGGIEFGRLCDIAEEGARFLLDHPLKVEKRVNLMVHFRDPHQQVITLGFDAVVIRSGAAAPYEIAVRFLGEPKFIQGDLSKSLNFPELRPGFCPDDYFLRLGDEKESATQPRTSKGMPH